MRNLKQIFLIFLACMIFVLPTRRAYAVLECLAYPPVCPLTLCAYQTQESTVSQLWEKTLSVYKSLEKGIKSIRKSVSSLIKTSTGLVSAVKSFAAKAIAWPFKKVGEVLGLTKDVDEDSEGATQDNSRGDITVEERIKRNLDTYYIESDGDYDTQHFVKERRQYIRQQATITLMARSLVLKNHLKDIKEVMDDMDKKVEQIIADSSKEANEGYNEATLLKVNKELRTSWFKLLSIQKQIEAAKLEFAANQAIAGMKAVKKVPKIEGSAGNSDQTTGGK